MPAARLPFEVFRLLQPSLPNPGAAGAFSLGAVPSRELKQACGERLAVLFAERQSEMADHRFPPRVEGNDHGAAEAVRQPRTLIRSKYRRAAASLLMRTALARSG